MDGGEEGRRGVNAGEEGRVLKGGGCDAGRGGGTDILEDQHKFFFQGKEEFFNPYP